MYQSELYHYGVKGMKWGVRRYQNKQGGYLPGAEGRYYTQVGRKRLANTVEGSGNSSRPNKVNRSVKKFNYDERLKAERREKLKKYAKIGAAAVDVDLVAYGAYKLRSAKVQNSIKYKRNVDTVLKKGTMLSTLSYDADRTKGADMFFATHTKLDQHQYNALFNKPIKEYLS